MHTTKMVAATLVFSLGTAASAAPVLSFCERMATDTGMKPAKDASAGAWQVNKLGGIGTMLFGGSVSFMMSVKPGIGADDATIAANDCKSDGKDVACTVHGPANFVLTVNGNNFNYVAEPGESAKIAILKSKILRCEALPPLA